MKSARILLKKLAKKHAEYLSLGKIPQYVYIGDDVLASVHASIVENGGVVDYVKKENKNELFGCKVILVEQPSYIRFCDAESYDLDIGRAELFAKGVIA